VAADQAIQNIRLIPPVGFSERWATSDLHFHGAQLRAGEMVPAVVNAFLDAFGELALDDRTGSPAGFTFRRVAPVLLTRGETK